MTSSLQTTSSEGGLNFWVIHAHYDVTARDDKGVPISFAIKHFKHKKWETEVGKKSIDIDNAAILGALAGLIWRISSQKRKKTKIKHVLIV
jgi:hypothetical protein